MIFRWAVKFFGNRGLILSGDFRKEGYISKPGEVNIMLVVNGISAW